MKNFTLNDLKPGMMVHTRKEGTYFVVDLPFDDKGTNKRILLGEDGFLYLNKYNEDLTFEDKDFDIIKVYDIRGKYGLGFQSINYLTMFDILYERKESREAKFDEFVEKMKMIFAMILWKK